MDFIDRIKDIERLKNALAREKRQFLVIYGRRRIGKSTLIRKILDFDRGDIYFLADNTSETNQREQLSSIIASDISDFDSVRYPTWESLLRSLNRQVQKRITVCLDEFPYLAKSCPSLPSVLQKLLDEKSLNFDLIICGSSQQLMQGYVLDSKEPLYGRADEIIKLQPIPAKYISEALHCESVQAIEEYAVWGGIPRYWELRSEYDTMKDAINALMLDARGILLDEPQRLLRDDMRDTLQTSTVLAVIGNGANKLSEIAARSGKDSNHITEPLSKLRELGYIRRDVPYGEEELKSKKGLYKIADPFLSFHFRFIAPYKSYIEMGKTDVVAANIVKYFSQEVSEYWEMACREFVTANTIDGVLYQMAKRWWGNVIVKDENGKNEIVQVELDVVAESFDKKHILIGECKWTSEEDAARLTYNLKRIIPVLPFIKEHMVHLCLFLKSKPLHETPEVTIFYPKDIC